MAAVASALISESPLYAQIAAVLRQRILAGRWRPGEQLPTLDELMREFGVARITVRLALDRLEQAGLIWRRRGRGTFVAERAGSLDWLTLESDWGSLLRSLEGNWPRLLNFSDSESQPLLLPEDGTPAPSYRYMCRLHGTGDLAYAVVSIYLDHRCYQLAPERFDRELVIPLLESLPQVNIGSARQTLTIGVADTETAGLLSIPVNAPVGQVRRVLQDRCGEVIYLGELTYRGDLVRLEINLKSG